jgi:DNA-binding NarL/FixJ family response regulator
VSAENRVRVLVADDHPSVRENLRYLINAEDDLECVGVAKDGITCVQLCRDLAPEILILDEDMPGAAGLRVLKYLRRELPDIQIIMYTLDADVFQAARTYGAVACVMKDDRYEVLLRTIRDAAPKVLSTTELY